MDAELSEKTTKELNALTCRYDKFIQKAVEEEANLWSDYGDKFCLLVKEQM